MSEGARAGAASAGAAVSSTESIHRFGAGGLVGIVTAPAVPRVGAPVVVLLNAGFVHRIGPFRMTVALARRLAGRGYHVLRFDQSGLGDSELRAGGAAAGADALEARIVEDVREAVDFALAHTGAGRAVVMGLCSGAINAHLSAVADTRIAGAVLVDGYAYPTPRFYLRHYAPRLVDSRKVAGFAARSARAVLADVMRRATPPFGMKPLTSTPTPTPTPAAGGAASGGAVYLQELPPRHRIESELRGLLQRGVRMLCIYSGGAGSYFNYPEQLADCFPSLDLADRVRVEHMPEADHTFALAVDRERLFGVIERWMAWWFG
jgi:pimeloyl-ACP methyl ester carboxylesterase